MATKRWLRPWTVTLWLGVMATWVVGLNLRGIGLPHVDRDATSFLTVEVRDGVTVGQVLSMSLEGLSGIEVELQPSRLAEAQQPINFALYEIVAEGTVSLIRQYDTRVADLPSSGTFRFDFPPIQDSAGRSYQLNVNAPGAPREAGIRLWATEGRHSAGGTLLVNGTDGFAELVYRCYATPGTGWARLVAHYAHPSWPIVAPGLLGVLFVAGATVLLFLPLAAVPTDRARED